MFPRVVEVKYKDKVHQYLRLVESYRDRPGRLRQRTVWKVGRLDKLLEEGKLEEIIEALSKFCKKRFVIPGEICNDESVSWGPILVARRLWEEMELDRIIRKLCQRRKLKFDVAERAFVLVANPAFGGGEPRYILGHKGRRDKDAKRWLSKLTDRWRECSKRVQVQEVESGKEEFRVLVVESDERKGYEERQRQRSMKRAEEHLKKVEEAVEKGRLKAKEKIAVRADRALHKNKGYRYFSYTIPTPPSAGFEYFLDEEKMKAEVTREGRYILTTNHPHISPEEAVAHYKELSDIEAGFREHGFVIRGRPYPTTNETTASALTSSSPS